MKKLLIAFVVFALLIPFAAFGTSAKEGNASVNAPYATEKPVIDGEIDDIWKFSPEVEVVNFGSNIYPATSTAKADKKQPVAKAKARFVWDPNTLYALVRVFDPTPYTDAGKPNPEDCDFDSVDFQISETNAEKESMRDDNVGEANLIPQNGIFNVNINGKVTGWGGVWFADKGSEKVSGAAKITDYGYVVEIAIPLQIIAAAEGGSMGLEVQINDNQFEYGRSAIRQWACETCLGHSNTEYLGNVVFVAASTEENPFTDEFTTIEEDTTTEKITTAAPETDPPADDTTAAPADDTTAAPADDTTAAPADDTTAAPADDTDDDDGPNVGLIIGIIAAVVVIAAIVAVILAKKKKQ